MNIRKGFTLLLLTPLLIACASVGSKTLYLSQSDKIQPAATIGIALPTVNDKSADSEEVQMAIAIALTNQLKSHKVQVKHLTASLPIFDSIHENSTIAIPSGLNVDYILSTRIDPVYTMGVASDYKVMYKLISTHSKSLVFHSKFNTQFGATIVVVPGFKDFPSMSEVMKIGINNGLYRIEKEFLAPLQTGN